MDNVNVELITISEMEEKNKNNFFIDAYQRGYRWTESEVTDLLKDIYEFAETSINQKDLFYCLQPLTLRKRENEEKWNVIDGQQRLTTLYLIFIYYCSLPSPTGIPEELPFNLSYEGKPQLEACFKELIDKKIKIPAEFSNFTLSYEDDIDCSFVIEAYKTILDFFYHLNTNRKTSSMSFSMKEVFNNRLKVIWYELENCDKEKEVTVFSNINMGKIPLTNAELIKAILLKKNEDNLLSEQKKNELELKQNQIAVEWEDMEAKLSDESFWNFLVNNEIHKYSTRLDFVFNILAHNINIKELIPADTKYATQNEVFSVLESANKEKFSFYVINNYFRLIKLENENGTNKNPIEPISHVWKKVQEYFRMFKEWYSDSHCYHLIGFLVGVSSDNYIQTLSELCEEYMYPKNTNNHKTEFEKYLRNRIQNNYFFKLKKNTSGPFTEKLCEDVIASLNYKDTSVEDLRNFFVLYNISYIEACEKGNRFSFESYKNDEISWDIEHINAIADQMPNDMINDSKENDRRVWLENADFIPDSLVTKNDKLNVNQLIKQILQDKSYLKKYQTSDKDLFPSVYEAVIDWFGDGETEDNSIGNLTLLDSKTNRSYKNNIFPIKRKTIIQRMSQDAFIPICTRNVFTKSYPESANSSNSNFLKWTKKDKEEYTADLVHFISNYLLGVKNGK